MFLCPNICVFFFVFAGNVGTRFEAALEPLLSVANEESIMFVMHNKAHEYYVFCRDAQKHGVSSKFAPASLEREMHSRSVQDLQWWIPYEIG